jgi:hypothetical protein
MAAPLAPSTAAAANPPTDSAVSPLEASTAGDGPILVQADPFTIDAPGLAPGQVEMTTMSTRPNLVTGEVVRVALRGLQPDDHVNVRANGIDVSSAFVPVAPRPGQAAGIEEGVVRGLRVGLNDLAASATGARYGSRTMTLTVFDHPIEGPVITGPHQYPFVCETEQSGMGGPMNVDCEAPAQVHWYTRDQAGGFHLLADPYAPYPAGTATTTSRGRSVPFVVRVDSRVINRSVTRIAVLDDPRARGPRAPFDPIEWNHRLVYHFGESCGTGYRQGSSQEADVFSTPSTTSTQNLAGPVLDLPGRLGQGSMVAQSTLTVFGVHCNEVLSAETLMMVKEHIIDDYGDVYHTIGGGASGGAIQQYTIADHYPGLLDAGTPLVSFPDVVSTAMTVYACVVLTPVFSADPLRWTPAKQTAVTGLATPGACQDWVSDFGSNVRPDNCPNGVPKSAIYNAATNRRGVRCDLQDDLRNILGIDPRTGFAYRPIDDLGVQYGLKALQLGVISPDDFIQLNRRTGGLDIDANPTPQRASMPDAEAQRMYEIGAVGARGATNLTPIIDQTIPVSDETPQLDIHDQIRPFETRARLDKRYGSHANQAIWSGLPLPSNAIVVADEWLDRLDQLQATNPSLNRAQLVAQSRPADATDQCRAGVTGLPNVCDQGVARHASPRQEAGGPFTEDNIKCQLRPVRASDYPASATSAQLDQIRRLFPAGVCDWSKPPVGWTATSSTWMSAGDSVSYDRGVSAGQQAAFPVVPYPLVRSASPTSAAAPVAAADRSAPAGELPRTGGAFNGWWLVSWLLAVALGLRTLSRAWR